MRAAIKQAEIAFSKNEIPVGAVIVYEDKIISQSHNLIRKSKPTRESPGGLPCRLDDGGGAMRERRCGAPVLLLLAGYPTRRS